MVPDLICSLDEQGNPLTNADLRQGQNVCYLGFAANRAFRKAEVFELFRPVLKALRYEGAFAPIEALQAEGGKKG